MNESESMEGTKDTPLLEDTKTCVETSLPLQDHTPSQSNDPHTVAPSDFQQTGREGGSSDGVGGCVDGSGHCGGGDGKEGEGSGESSDGEGGGGDGEGGDGEGDGENDTHASDSQMDSDLVLLSTVTSNMEDAERDG